ncbi:MAG TPA: POTRA domain-containing protein, partial [Vicinamibacteria bacterium]
MLAALLWGMLLAPPRVDSIRLEAPDPQRYAATLGLTPGTPYDAEAVRAAVLRLFATGDFEDVVVESSPGERGVALVFRTRGAPRFLRAEARGDRGVSAKGLVSAARLRRGEPLWPKRLRAAAIDAERHLQAEGWLDARVEAKTEPLPEGALVAFFVSLGPRVQLRFAQVDRVPPPLVLEDLVRPGHGEVYKREKAQAAAERMRERLANAGYWRAVVELEETRATGSARLDLVFRVRIGPAMSTEVRGYDLPRGPRGQVHSLLRDGEARPDALEGGAERIEEHLHHEGYRDAVVRYRTEGDGALEEVVYEVAPGNAATIVAVEVRGAPELLGLLDLRPGEPLRDEAVEEAARTLRDALRAKGHADAKVEVVVRDGGGQLPVLFRAEPGPATMVAEVVVDAPAGPDASSSTELLLRVGAPYEARTVAVDRSRILAAYRNAGYLDAAVDPELLFEEDRTRVRVILHVTPGPRALAGQVIVTGIERTQERVVRRELSLDPGQPLSLEALLDGQKRLSGLGLFERVSLTPLADAAPSGARDVLVSLSEAPVTTVSYGLGYSERDLFRGSVEVTRRNLFGLDRTLTAFGRVAFRGQRFVLSYREPFFLGRRRDFFGTAFYDDEDRTTFDFTRIGGIAQTTRRFGETRALILRLTYQATDVFNVLVPVEEIDRQFRTYTLAGPSASVVNDNRDNPLDARRGHFLSADVLFSVRVL